jgi:transposase
MVNVPKAFPKEFRRDVVAVARKGEAPVGRIAKDFGISESCLQRWLKIADVEDGVKPGVSHADAVELRDAKKRIKLLEQEVEVLRRAAAYLSQASLPK